MMVRGRMVPIVTPCLLAILLVLVPFPVDGQVNTTNPQFLFIPGIGHGAWAFYEVITFLQQAGYSALSVDLAAHGISKLRPADVRTIDQYLQPVDEVFRTAINRPVIIVGHSLGGGSISVMMERYPQLISKGVFLCSIMPVDGQTFFEALPASSTARLGGDRSLIFEGNPINSVRVNISTSPLFLYNRSPQKAITLASTLLVPTPYLPGQEPISLTPRRYGSVRRFYIKTLEDRAITPSEQEQIIRANPPERVFPLPGADHAPFFSQPWALSRILIKVANL